MLLEAGADLEAKDRRGWTPIHAAVASGRDKFWVVLRMADRGADLVSTGGEPGLVRRYIQKHDRLGP